MVLVFLSACWASFGVLHCLPTPANGPACLPRGHVVLMPDFSLPLEYYLIPFLIIVGICLILIVVFMVGESLL